jgi:GTP-binding protein
MDLSSNNNLPLVVIFGRANVGKSTLFNRLTEKNQAMVSAVEGTTRDANISSIAWQGRNFRIVDTGGILDLKYLSGKKITTGDIEAKVQKQARDYLKRADLILFIVDNKIGLTPYDRVMADYLKKKKELENKIIIVANKVDGSKYAGDAAQFNKLSLGEPITVSAATGSGTGDLLDVIVDKIFFETPLTAEEEQIAKKNLRVAIVGKPNVGKSSLINAILGYERVIVSPTPHTTREPQDTELEYNGENIILVDTAGISRQGHKSEGLEKYGMQKSLAALKHSDIALFVIDISEPITHQDAKIIDEIVERKVSFIIIANKWDKIKDRDTKKFTNFIYTKFPFADYVPIQFVSASSGMKVNKILDQILLLSEQRKTEISDSILNKLLNKLVKIHRPPKGGGDKHPRVFELNQIKSNPPVFEVQIGSHDTLDNSYLRFIENRLREKFGFLGAPITMVIARGKKVHGKANSEF